MSLKRFSLIGFFLIAACSSHNDPYAPNGSFGMMNNDKEFGVVEDVSVNGRTFVRNGNNAVGAAAAGGASSGVASTIGNTIFSPISTAFTGLTNSVTGTTTPPTVQEGSKISYLIKKDNGEEIKIDQLPEVGDRILYPGERAMIQSNGDYIRVHPADVEERLR